MKEDFKILWGGQKSQNEGGFKKFEFYLKGL